MRCPVCARLMPHPRPVGKRREYCSTACTNRAAHLRDIERHLAVTLTHAKQLVASIESQMRNLWPGRLGIAIPKEEEL